MTEGVDKPWPWPPESPVPLRFPMCTSAHTARDHTGEVFGRYWCTREEGHGGLIHEYRNGNPFDAYQWPRSAREVTLAKRWGTLTP